MDRSILRANRSDPDNFDHPDIVLVQAPCWGNETPPLSLATLSGYLRGRGVKVLPIDLNIECYLARPPAYEDAWHTTGGMYVWSTVERARAFADTYQPLFDQYVDLILATGTRVVGFSCQISAYLLSLRLARTIKQRDPDVLVIVGGPQVARYQDPDGVLALGFVDVIVHGEGENTLYDVLRRHAAGQSLVGCPGTSVRHEGKRVEGPPRLLQRKLDDFPLTDFRDYDFHSYVDSTILPVVSSRGCVNDCNFCAEATYWQRFRPRSGARIFEEVKTHFERHPHLEGVYFQDSLVNGRVDDIVEFGRLVVESGMKLRWGGKAIVHKDMTYERAKMLADSGCTHLSFGLEAYSTHVLFNIGKRAARGTDADEVVRNVSRAGLRATYNFMFGLPGETEADFQETLDFVRRNKDHLPKVHPAEAFCSFTPGTPGYEHPERWGIEKVETIQYWESQDGTNTWPVRLRRFEQFCTLVHELGIPSTYPSPIYCHRERALGDYYHHEHQWAEAARWYREAIRVDGSDEHLSSRLADCERELAAAAQFA